MLVPVQVRPSAPINGIFLRTDLRQHFVNIKFTFNFIVIPVVPAYNPIVYFMGVLMGVRFA